MNSIYHSEFGKIRVVKEPLNKCWVSVSDVLSALHMTPTEELSDYIPSKFIKHFGEQQVPVEGGLLTMSEAGLIYLIKYSKAKAIDLFIDWMLDRALPQIRFQEQHHSRYNTPRIKAINTRERTALIKIKNHLKKGDATRISTMTGKSKSLVSNTINGIVRNEGIISLAFNIALFNRKDSILEDYYDAKLIDEINEKLA